MIVRGFAWWHRLTRGHDPDWVVLGYDRGFPLWVCAVCDFGGPLWITTR